MMISIKIDNLMISVGAFPRTLGIRTRGVLSKPIAATTTVLNWANSPFPTNVSHIFRRTNQQEFTRE